jgi:arsenate reductase-like glutaredoxin family protein
MFLTTDDIERLTGYIAHKKQARWLREHGIKHMVNRYGQPLVTQKQIEDILETTPSAKIKQRIAPNEAALKQIMGLN